MQDPLQDVCVSSGRRRLEEVCGDQLASIRYVRALELGGARNHRRQIAENPTRIRVPLEDTSQKSAVSAGQVDDPAQTGKIVSVEYRRHIDVTETGHSGVEDGALFGTLGKIFEERLSEHLFKGGLAGLHRLVEIAPGPPEKRFAIHHCHWPNGLRMV